MKTRILERSLCSLFTCLWLGWCAVAQAATSPTITGIWPATPIPGTMTFVFGANFSLVPGENIVSFGGVPAPISQPIDSTLLVFFTPSGGTGGLVCVGTLAGDTCLVPAAPVCSGGLCVTGIWPGD
ncbi:MAG: IPT/TIG domain-containing protein, partial [Actinomycetota bacterium]